MMIGIVTIVSNNFGNRLQNFAMQEILKQYGDPYTLKRTKKNSFFKDLGRRVKRTRVGRFSSFNKKYIKFSKYYIETDKADPKLAEKFDCFVAGSDQIWNPHYAKPENDIVGESDFLTFARPEQKIAYAASFGIAEIPAEKKEKIAKYLKDFREISVREEAGAKIIHDLVGRQVPVVADPTLLLPREKWCEIMRKPSTEFKTNNVLVYVLSRCDKLYDELHSQGAEYTDIMKKDKKNKLPSIGPSEFLYMIDNSEAIWTNSFHALVFAILFHKPCKVYPREGMDMSSRIYSLCIKLGIDDHFGADGVLELTNKEDWQQIDSKLQELRNDSRLFLNNVFGL